MALAVPFTCMNAYAQSELIGVWKAEFDNGNGLVEVKWNITRDGYEIDLRNDGSVEISGQWKIENNQLILWDTGGPMACADTDKGTYTYSVTGDILKLTLISDNCVGRSKLTPTVTWKREK